MRTSLYDVHKGLGALFTDFAGWAMPVRYTSELAEHRAVREAAGLFDLSHMGELEVTGPEAGAALDYALVGHFTGIEPGRARYTMMCDAEGGVLDDLVVYRLGESQFLVVANAGNAAIVFAELIKRTGAFEAEVTDRASETALIAVQGPRASGIVGAMTSADLTSLKYYAGMPAKVGGQEVFLARTGYTGEDGFELFVPSSEAEALWNALTKAGESHGLLPAGLASRDTLRLEAGMPLYGNELTAEVSPFEANLGRVVKFAKRDFVGKEALERRREPAKVLAGLRGTGRRSPRHGCRVLDGERGVGEVTSGALSPTLGYPIAMAYLPKELSEPGTKLTVDVRGRIEPVEVVELPFYRR